MNPLPLIALALVVVLVVGVNQMLANAAQARRQAARAALIAALEAELRAAAVEPDTQNNGCLGTLLALGIVALGVHLVLRLLAEGVV